MNKIKMLSLLAAAAMMTGSVAMAETYSATGNGYHGEMTVNVTIEDGKITDVDYDSMNADGTKKSEDQAYRESMEPVST